MGWQFEAVCTAPGCKGWRTVVFRSGQTLADKACPACGKHGTLRKNVTRSKSGELRIRRPLPQARLRRKCRICGCTDDDCSQCIAKTGEPCHWVEPNLCSACAGAECHALPGGECHDVGKECHDVE